MMPAAVICLQNKRGQILLLHRKHHPYGWCLPGGRVEDRESLNDAVVRELREETGIDVLVPQFKGLTQAHNGRDVGIFYYRIEKKNPKVVLSNEHDAYMWIVFSSEWFKEQIIENLLGTSYVK